MNNEKEPCMSHQYFCTRRDNGLEEVIHIGETDTLVGFRSDPGIAAALAELKKLGGQAARAEELSNAEFDIKKKELGV
jgi:hypothetical protein